MNIKSTIGTGICLLIFIGSFLMSGSASVYWNLAAFLVVLSGVGTAMMLGNPLERIMDAFRAARRSFGTDFASHGDIVRTLLDLSVKSKVDGLLSLEKKEREATSSFLKSGLILLVDNYSEEEIRDCLGAEMHFFNMRQGRSERVFRTMARMAPAFGVAGSVIGLVGMLMGLNDTAAILTHIPVALISTLYGLVIGNLVFAPVAERINDTTRTELLNQKLIMEGVIAISKEQNPYKLERKLASFLPPEERNGNVEMLRGITRKYIERRKKAAEPKDTPEGATETARNQTKTEPVAEAV